MRRFKRFQLVQSLVVNYFDFFDLPVAPTVDQALLKRRYYEKSRAYHPDFHTLADRAQQSESLEQSTVTNQAYQTLRDSDRRLQYFLELKGALAEEGKNEVPQDFLMEMMEINESMMELEFDSTPSARQRVETQINALDQTLTASVQSILDEYQDAVVKEAELSALKDYYLKRRYLLRIRDNLATFAGR